MSKLYDKYLVLKAEQKEDTVYLFKAGIFYTFISNDATQMSKLLNLKLVHLNNNVFKCSFPVNSFNKYAEILNENNITYLIIDETVSNVNLNKNYINNIYIKDIIEKIKQMDLNICSPHDAYNFLYNIQLIANRLDNSKNM